MADYGKWRLDVLKLIRTGRQLERIARSTELPFEVRHHWPGLDWCQHGESLEDFRARVKRAADRLGAPDKVEATHWLGAYGDNPPDLVATWRLKDGKDEIRAVVRALSPKGCRIKPGTEYQDKREPEIHPECAAVLRELEDL